MVGNKWEISSCFKWRTSSSPSWIEPAWMELFECRRRLFSYPINFIPLRQEEGGDGRRRTKSGERWKKRNACLFGTLFSTNLALLFTLKILLFVKYKPMKLAANFISKDPFRLPFLTRKSNSHAKALGMIFICLYLNHVLTDTFVSCVR